MKFSSFLFLKTLIIVLISVFLCACFRSSLPQDDLKMNQIQIIGSHNSYKKAIDPALMELILSYDANAKGLDYRHLSLEEQLALGLRSFELDVLYDPTGGRYAKPRGIELLKMQGVEVAAVNADELADPGFKVLHVPDIDFRTHCSTFKACLATIKAWSDQQPDHLPLIITLNPKTSGVGMPGFTEVLPFSVAVLEQLDQEIREVLGAKKMITPALVKGDFPTLRSAILGRGWPLLKEVRGKVMFVLDAGDEITEQYRQLDEASRLQFVNVAPDHPEAAFFVMNDPIQQETAIQELVRQGFMIRTRADANTVEARTGDRTRFEAALRSGAQLISTDYYVKSLSPNQDFEIIFTNRSYSQCNPILTAGNNCGL